MHSRATRATWLLRMVIIGVVLGLSAAGYLISPANATLSQPGRVVPLTENNILPKPYTLDDTEGEWSVLTVTTSELSVAERWFYSATGAAGRHVTTDAEASLEENEEATPEEQATSSRQKALNTAAEIYTGFSSMLVVVDPGTTDVPEGSRLLSINHTAPDISPKQPAGTWLIAPPEGGVEVHEVTTDDVTLTYEPISPLVNNTPNDPDIDAVSAPIFSLNDIGGPSAGLTLTLAWLDAMTEGDLTGGLNIAATGALGTGGSIVPVGGVDLKLLAAQEIGADLVMIPAGYDGPIPEGLNVHEVSTVEEALQVVADHS